MADGMSVSKYDGLQCVAPTHDDFVSSADNQNTVVAWAIPEEQKQEPSAKPDPFGTRYVASAPDERVLGALLRAPNVLPGVARMEIFSDAASFRFFSLDAAAAYAAAKALIGLNNTEPQPPREPMKP